MPLQNRVTPFGDVISHPARGLVYGNRGCLHDAEGRIRRRFAGKRWIACRLEFRGWRRGPLMQPGRFTELFFLDDATALAAGHRPCALCRRDDYRQLEAVFGRVGADAIDARLHAERLGQRARRQAGELPDGTFVVRRGEAWLVRAGALRRWTPAGYAEAAAATGVLEVITPASLVELLRLGWSPLVPFLHPTASA